MTALETIAAQPTQNSPTPYSTGDLIRASHPSGAARRHLLVIRLFADVSGKDRDVCRVAGGYVATEAQWDIFDREWRAALGSAGVKRFHATDFYSFHGEFEGWDQNLKRHKRFSQRFGAIASQQTAAGLAFGVDTSAFQRILSPILDKYRPSKSGRYSSLMLVAFNLLFDVAKMRRPKGEKIAAVFESEEGIGGVLDYYNYRKKHGEDWTQAYVSIGTASKDDFVALQAADLLAHEAWRRTCDYLQAPHKPHRKSYLKLLEQPYLSVNLSSEADLRRDAPTIERWLASHERD